MDMSSKSGSNDRDNAPEAVADVSVDSAEYRTGVWVSVLVRKRLGAELDLQRVDCLNLLPDFLK